MDGELFCVYDASGVQLCFIRETAPLLSSPSGGGDSAALRAESHTLSQTHGTRWNFERRMRIVQFLHLIPLSSSL